ncbi:glycoside hydrolase family 88 protein [Chelativorans sp. AA-79]|uniref:glycoside hydrolase family 88/105 protein n=1 Tax=Chelativorans sp. AA-79 TaxID=3028735 RepID=UPI0023F96963|nr:glycoside hydrolase family 88 protein [Chelativorans sp. AA-79]WEX11812.1 glycoside hydrolase family 88 protein [Chelativorans sp. AA-79]
MLMDYFDAYATTYEPYKGGAWCYEDGCVYRGLSLLHGATGEERWLRHLKRLVDAQVSAGGDLAGYSTEDFNIDNILSGRALIHLYRLTAEERYFAAAELLVRQLRAHPRTKSGVYWHKKIYPWQIWLDGLYMGLPFQIEFGQLAQDDALVEDALSQLLTALDLTQVPETGLYSHGYDESRTQTWADPQTGRSPAHWARALGWLSMALVDIMELAGRKRAAETGIGDATASLLKRLLQLRTGEGLWFQVIDRPGLAGNYPETSATAMFAYALLKAGRLGLGAFERAGEEGLRALAASSLQEEDDGRLRLAGICQVAGLGGLSGVYRDGTAAYYLSEPVVEDDAKGVGPLMMAKAEAFSAASARAEAPLLDALR